MSSETSEKSDVETALVQLEGALAWSGVTEAGR